MNIRNLFTKQPSKKPENCYIGKYQIKKIINNHTIELKLSSNLHVYLVSHVNFLKLAAINDLHSGHVQPLSPPIKIDERAKYKVTNIVDSCFFGKSKKLQYRIQKRGYTELK